NQYTFYYDDGTKRITYFDTPAGSDWGFHNLTSDLNPAKNLSGFSIYGTSAGPAYLDDFTLRQIPEPASALIASIGLFALASRRRHRSQTPLRSRAVA